VAVISSSALVIVLLWILTPRHFEWFGRRPFEATTFVNQVQQLKELVAVKYRMQRVVGLRESKLPLGEESILLIVEGEVDAGVDLGKLRAQDVAIKRDRNVTVTLPPAEVFKTFIDEKGTKVWDRRITWWTPWVPYNPDLEHQARLQAISDFRQAALDAHVLPQAQKNAETALRDFCNAVGLKAEFKTRSLD
jgi:hypothetical protein